MARNEKVVPLHPEGSTEPQPSKEPKEFSPQNAWTPALAATGHVAVVRGFLHHYSTLNPPLTGGEALFVIHLMDHKWGKNAPFPSYKRIARRMGISVKMARRHAQSLEIKGYLRRWIRTAQTNLFDLTPLFEALERKLAKEAEKKAEAAVTEEVDF